MVKDIMTVTVSTLPTELENLLNDWGKDSFIDETEPGRALLNVPKLHHKYLRILTFYTLKVKELQSQYNEKRQLFEEWYRGNLNNPDDVAEHGLGINPTVYSTSGKVERALDADSRLTKILLKKIVYEEVVEATKAIMKELNNMVWELRSFIDHEKFIGGPR